MKHALFVVLAACGGPAPTATTPTPGTPADAMSADAPIDAPADAPPEPSAAAPAWIFRFATSERTETWTLRYEEGRGVLLVEGARIIRYVGTAYENAGGVELDVAADLAHMKLACKPAKLRATSIKCNDPKGPPLDVLECFHADFKTPMTFGRAPGIEYVTSDCTGYRVIAAP